MEVKRNVRDKLDVPEDRLADLHATIRQFNDAANYTVEHGMRLLTVPEGKRPSGLGDGQLALKSGTMNLSDGLTSAEFRSEGGGPRPSPRLQSWVADAVLVVTEPFRWIMHTLSNRSSDERRRWTGETFAVGPSGLPGGA